jgi:hypothetical protein
MLSTLNAALFGCLYILRVKKWSQCLGPNKAQAMTGVQCKILKRLETDNQFKRIENQNFFRESNFILINN